MLRYFWNILIWLDQGFNVVFLFGDPDETVSSRAHKNSDKPVWSQLAKFLNWIDPGHTERSHEPDEGERAIWRDK